MSRLTWAKARALLDERPHGDVLRPSGGHVLSWMGAPVCVDWPTRLIADHVARLQDAPAWRAYRDAVSAAIAGGGLHAQPCETIVAMTLQVPNGFLIERGTTTYMGPGITAADFVAWLGAQGETPSAHIAAWVEATGGASREAATACQPVSDATKRAQRQDARLAACEAEGIVFDRGSLLRLPDGIGTVAQKLDITRQSLATDVKAALKRRFEASRQGRE